MTLGAPCVPEGVGVPPLVAAYIPPRTVPQRTVIPSALGATVALGMPWRPLGLREVPAAVPPLVARPHARELVPDAAVSLSSSLALEAP